MILGSTVKLQLTMDTAEKPLESRLDNPNYFDCGIESIYVYFPFVYGSTLSYTSTVK